MRKRRKNGLRSIRAAIIAACAGFVILGGAVLTHAQQTVDITAEVPGDLTATIDSVKPQGRVGADQTNDDTTFYLTVRTEEDGDDSILFTQPDLEATDADGTFSTPIELTGVSPGTYDIGIKGHQHLTRVLDDIALSDGNNVLNFTQADNSTGRGSVVLLAGDINGAGTDPSTLGDDVINSVDISVLLANLDDEDPSGNAERSNLNQDAVVNSVDISLMLSNLDEEGDR